MKITTDDLKSAIEKTGLSMKSGHFFMWTDPQQGWDCGCPLTVLYCAQFGRPSFGQQVTDWAEAKYGQHFVYGFINGVDSNTKDGKLETYTENELVSYKDGYENGRFIRAAFNL